MFICVIIEDISKHLIFVRILCVNENSIKIVRQNTILIN
jgi:hypothetical protein